MWRHNLKSYENLGFPGRIDAKQIQGAKFSVLRCPWHFKRNIKLLSGINCGKTKLNLFLFWVSAFFSEVWEKWQKNELSVNFSFVFKKCNPDFSSFMRLVCLCRCWNYQFKKSDFILNCLRTSRFLETLQIYRNNLS